MTNIGWFEDKCEGIHECKRHVKSELSMSNHDWHPVDTKVLVYNGEGNQIGYLSPHVSAITVMVEESYREQIRLETKFLYCNFEESSLICIHIRVDVFVRNNMEATDKYRIKNELCC